MHNSLTVVIAVKVLLEGTPLLVNFATESTADAEVRVVSVQVPNVFEMGELVKATKIAVIAVQCRGCVSTSHG